MRDDILTFVRLLNPCGMYHIYVVLRTRPRYNSLVAFRIDLTFGQMLECHLSEV